jgi:hypothetical protein
VSEQEHRREVLESEFLKLIEQLQPKPEYLNLFREIVLDVWQERQKETIKLVAALESRVAELKAKRQKLIEAFVSPSCNRQVCL